MKGKFTVEFPYLNNENIAYMLATIAGLHTLHNRSDLDYDLETLRKFRQNTENENSFFWISRKSGTNLFSERNVFIHDTFEYKSFQDWFSGENKPLLFHLDLKYRLLGQEQGHITGMDFAQVANFAKENAQKIFRVLVTDDNFLEHSIPLEEYTKECKEYGFCCSPNEKVKYLVENEPLLQSIILQNRANTLAQSVAMEGFSYIEDLEKYCNQLYVNEADYSPYPFNSPRQQEENAVDEEDLDR